MSEAEKVMHWANSAMTRTHLGTRPPARRADIRCAAELYRMLAEAVEDGEQWAQDPAEVEQILRRAGDLMATGGAEWPDPTGTALALAGEAAMVR